MDTAYFCWKLKIIKIIIFGFCHTKKYYSFVYLYWSCPMNSTSGTGKKKESWNAKCVDVHEYDPNGHEISEMLRELALSTRLNFYFLSVVNYTRICKVCTHHDFKTLLFFWNYKL